MKLKQKVLTCYDYISTVKDADFAMDSALDDAYFKYRQNWGVSPGSPDNHPAVPYQIDIDVADLCNLKCKFCFDRTRKRTGAVMQDNVIEALIDQLTIHPVFALNFGFCSEPLVRFDLVKRILEVARPICGISDLFVHTNGLLLNEKIAEILVNLEVNGICISIDAANGQYYQELCGSSDYDQLVQNVKMLKMIRDKNKKKNPLIRTSMVMVPENENHKDEFVGNWNSIADKIEFQTYRDVSGKISTTIGSDTPTHICPWPFMRMSIWPTGQIGVCPFTGSLNPDIALDYNIKDDDIRDVWNSSQVQTIRQRLFKNLNGTCISCISDFKCR